MTKAPSIRRLHYQTHDRVTSTLQSKRNRQSFLRGLMIWTSHGITDSPLYTTPNSCSYKIFQDFFVVFELDLKLIFPLFGVYAVIPVIYSCTPQRLSKISALPQVEITTASIFSIVIYTSQVRVYSVYDYITADAICINFRNHFFSIFRWYVFLIV